MDDAKIIAPRPEQPPSTAAGEALTPDERDDLAELVRRAFVAASRKKPDDWRNMGVPVLKNRLLQISQRAFNEADYGLANVADIDRLLPELVEVDRSTRTPMVRWIADEKPERAAHTATLTSTRIREDLWNSVMDYSSGRFWTWSLGRAVALEGATANALPLPTLKAEELGGWRHEFTTNLLEQLTETDRAFLEAWASSPGRTADLPENLRAAWNDTLRTNVKERLEEWFLEHELPIPDDLIQSARAVPAHRPARDLRSFLTLVVGSMEASELSSILLPASAVHRYVNSLGK